MTDTLNQLSSTAINFGNGEFVVVNNYLYAINSTAISVWNITTPTAPVRVLPDVSSGCSGTLGGIAYDSRGGGYLYVTSKGNHSIVTFDLDDPLTPNYPVLAASTSSGLTSGISSISTNGSYVGVIELSGGYPTTNKIRT